MKNQIAIIAAAALIFTGCNQQDKIDLANTKNELALANKRAADYLALSNKRQDDFLSLSNNYFRDQVTFTNLLPALQRGLRIPVRETVKKRNLIDNSEGFELYYSAPSKSIPIKVTVHRPTGDVTKVFNQQELEPSRPVIFPWNLTSGDTLTIESDGYRPTKITVP